MIYSKIFMIVAVFFMLFSCTIDKTDFEAEIRREIPQSIEFKETMSFKKDEYQISISSLNGVFYKGYNEIRLKILNTKTNQPVQDSEVTFLPIFIDDNAEKSTCPHQYQLTYESDNQYYKGYSVFNKINESNNWNLYISFTDGNQKYTVNQNFKVAEQENKNLNMTEFVGNDGKKYCIALIAPLNPKVAENELIAGVYQYDEPAQSAGEYPDASQFSYSKAEGYTLLLDPRMPEPSMGNHSSPNNVDLTQKEDGNYHGVVNYTMTGNWTLNFILLNKAKEIIKGTEVSKKFTPGIEGEKGELHIDILF